MGELFIILATAKVLQGYALPDGSGGGTREVQIMKVERISPNPEKAEWELAFRVIGASVTKCELVGHVWVKNPCMAAVYPPCDGHWTCRECKAPRKFKSETRIEIVPDDDPKDSVIEGFQGLNLGNLR